MLDSVKSFLSLLGPIRVVVRARELIEYRLVGLDFVFLCAGQLREDNRLDYKLESIVNVIKLCN